MRSQIFQITTERNVFVVRRWERLCFPGGWAGAGLKCDQSHCPLYVSWASQLLARYQLQPSFHLNPSLHILSLSPTTPLDFLAWCLQCCVLRTFASHLVPYLISLLSHENLASLLFSPRICTRLFLYVPDGNTGGLSALQPQSCLRNKGTVCCFPSCGQSHPRIKGKLGLNFPDLWKKPPYLLRIQVPSHLLTCLSNARHCFINNYFSKNVPFFSIQCLS